MFYCNDITGSNQFIGVVANTIDILFQGSVTVKNNQASAGR